jgi:hypothetical protein
MDRASAGLRVRYGEWRKPKLNANCRRQQRQAEFSDELEFVLTSADRRILSMALTMKGSRNMP